MLNLTEIQKTFPECNDLKGLPVPRSGQKIVLRGNLSGRQVALKLVKQTGKASEVARTMREVEAVTRLHSSYVPEVIDHGTRALGGQPRLYIIEDFIEGESYREVLTNGVDLPVVLKLGRVLFSACADFEKTKLVHRDIKPENIMVGTDGKIWVIDFGIVRVLDAESLTKTEQYSGPCTIGYGAPEQMRNLKPQINIRADLFSVGMVLYESLAGKHPFFSQGLDPLQVFQAMQKADTPRLANVDDELADFISTLTSRFPSRRPQNSAEAIFSFEKIAQRLGGDE